ncbi:flagellar protein FlaC [Halohasta litchfieldiae]|jgi:archaellum component FlaD/FlaE|uniref:Flagellar protein FlaC n=1 Tax=Halohasta litchfieldiae TaxID=1073996 RepID=A0A1H6QYU9_9EURY|nr:FlaD/FlaE family flagellar protein [Halohasta litchfieldiae]ATW88559.1 flagellar protein FlaC [Halohasta litchfieldiae]SEI48673.1 flagellar protein FlaC [Halohasta litchfieldiae]
MGLGISLLVTLPALDGISLFGTELSVLGPTAAGTAGLVGASIIDRILDSDDDDDSGGGGGGGDGLMDDDGGEFGGMDDEFGGGGGGDDFGGMDDDFGGMDDDFGGGGGGGGGGADMDELEHQVDELENEVASLSSTVNTVKSENTEISDRIEDVEEDVRNLLDIYEMVTRGINPFVDEQDAGEFDVGGGGGGGGGGGLGLFDDGEEETQQDDDVDDSVMSEDADGFFDDDFEEDDDDEFGDDEFDDGGMDDEFDELDEDDADAVGGESESEEMVSDQDSTGGKSFSELKDEYDSGDASWAEEGEEPDDDLGGMDDSLDDGDDLAMDDSFGEMDDDEDDLGGMDDSLDDGDNLAMDDTDDSLGNGSDGEMAASTQAETADESTAPVDDGDTQGDFEYVSSDQLSSSGDKPYLTAIPGDYVGDLVVMEWLEFLVEESNVTDAARAVNYYERIDWIDRAAADHLRSFLSGFGQIDRNKVDQPGTDQLNRTHHVHSLKYIMKLNNGTTATSVILDRWDTFATGDDGL